MKIEKIDLYSFFKIARPEGGKGYLSTYVLDNCVEKRIRPAMLIIPGGGYVNVSPREAEPVAIKYMNEGFNAFVLDYSVKSCSSAYFPTQLIEGAMAMAYIRVKAKALGINKKQVAVTGFSAGGHLTGMLATMYDAPEIKALLARRAELVRPDAVVLSYPVITSGENAHRQSIENLTGGHKELEQMVSIEKNVTENSSPAFIWTTVGDPVVPSENSLELACAYKKAGVPFELHVFANGNGWHGLSIATSETTYVCEYVQPWVKLSIAWLEFLGFRIN